MKLNRARLAASIAAGVMLMFAAVLVFAGTTGIISGVVKNSEDGKPLSGANVFIEGTKLTTVTDANGFFVITNVPPGEYSVRSEMVGYKTESMDAVQVQMDATATVEFDMTLEAIAETQVEVVRPRPMITPEAVNTLNLLTSGQEDLTKADPAMVRTVPGVLSTLPGVVVDPNGMGGVHMRGGRADQIGYYIEGIPVVDPNTGFFSTNLFTTGVNKFQTYPGGFGSEFGNAISGVLNEVKLTGTQMTGLHTDTQGGNQNFGSALGQIGGESSGGFSYYAGSILQRSEMDGGPLLREQEISDNVVKCVWPWKNDKLTVMALEGSLAGFLDTYHDTGNMNQPTPHEKDFLRQRYTVAAASWSHNFSPKSFLTVQPYYIFSTTAQNVIGGYGSLLNAWSAQKGIQLGYTSQLNERHLFKAGGLYLASTNSFYVFYGFPYYRADVNTAQRALFVEDQIKMSDKLTAQLGARYEGITYDRTGRTWVPGEGYSGAPIGDATESIITPRAGVSYAIDERTAWKTSWGRYSKWIPASSVQLTYFDPDSPYSEAYMSGIAGTDPQTSSSFDLSYEKQLTPSTAMRITPFYVTYDNLGDYVQKNGISTFTNIGEGRASGVELYFRKKMSKNWQGWLSYTYATSKANRADMGFADQMFYTSWDQRHTLSLVADCKTGKWSHSIRADFGSGRADIATIDPLLQQRANPFVVATYSVSYDLPQDSRFGDSIYLSLFNIFNNRQPLQFDWSSGFRAVDSKIPSRFLSVGLVRAF